MMKKNLWVNLSCPCGASYCLASLVAHHRLSKGCCYTLPRCCSEIGAVLQSPLRKQQQIQQGRGKIENWKGDESQRELVTSEKASNAEGRPEAEGGLGRWSKMDLSPREGWPAAAAAAGASSSECSRSEFCVWSWSCSSSAEE